ncbi:zinc/cadmium resistance protein [Puntigrus tetrazona]|uniref:zinc/cadmium resistance protein n=1 Tax=Puntigrus tetrazona TaxID=1606681 RepID=UPI001C8AAF79|nr:zinc/cadmium resistance protein [Puntigrus tetrazona]
MAGMPGSSHVCLLVLTLLFLVFEIVVGQICRSLLIAVDSFHTLHVFINLALSAVKHPSSSPCSTTAGPSHPNISSPGAEDYRRMRLKPFGVLISALLMASQCVSISLEILTHLVQPEPIQHPPLSIAVGGTSLIFNILVLAWRRSSSRGTDGAADGFSKSLMRKEPQSTSERKGDALQDDALMFCNPEASSVLDPDQGCSAEILNPSASEPVRSSLAQTSVPRASGSSQDIVQRSERLPEEPRHSTGTEPAVSPCAPGSRRQLCSIGEIQDLLASVLILTNGLVLLLSAAHCHRPHSDCHLLVYLDAAFSVVCVLVLFSAAVPRLRRYGLLVLQAAPLHLSVAQVRLRLAGVPGVLSVHELHVWQLSEELLVASLHVRCPAGLSAERCADLMARITAVLNAFGVERCTVQPEFVRSGVAARGGSACSLSCGQECAGKLCCSPQLEETSCPESPVRVQDEGSCSPAPHSADQMKDVVIENTYL